MTLPQGWAETTLGDCQAKTSSIDPQREPATVFDLFSVPAHASYEPDCARGSEIGSAKQQVQANDVLLCKIVPHIRRGWVVPAPQQRPQIASGEWIVFRDHALEPEFLRRFVVSDDFHHKFMLTVSGVGGSLMRARPADAAKIAVPVPPAAEQRRIVAKLDALTARLARARAELDRVPALAQRLRQTFVGKLAEVSGSRLVRFDEILDYKGGSQPPKSSFHAEPGPDRIRLLQIRDFASDAKAVYINDNGKWPRCQIDDVMIGRYGASVGKILSGKAGAYNVALVKMIFDQSIVSPRFLYHWLTGVDFQERLSSVSRSAQDGFNKGDLADLPFPLLPIAEQEKVAAATDNAFARADRLEWEATRARALIDRLEAAILARAFRGELVPQDPADEPASVLLDRIRAQRAIATKPKRAGAARPSRADQNGRSSS